MEADEEKKEALPSSPQALPKQKKTRRKGKKSSKVKAARLRHTVKEPIEEESSGEDSNDKESQLPGDEEDLRFDSQTGLIPKALREEDKAMREYFAPKRGHTRGARGVKHPTARFLGGSSGEA